jgi:hypothetical protein
LPTKTVIVAHPVFSNTNDVFLTSCSGNFNFFYILQTYNYGHNLISSTEEKEDNAIFKIPAPGKSKNMLSKSTVQRSSQRLQMKKCISELNLNEINGTPNKTLLLEHVVTTNEPALEESNRRRSVRLQVKRSATQGGSEFKKRVMNVPHKKQEANTDNEETSTKNTSRTNES